MIRFISSEKLPSAGGNVISSSLLCDCVNNEFDFPLEERLPIVAALTVCP